MLPDYFGKKDPRNMPPGAFPGAHDLDLSSAVRADIFRQNYSVRPRHWYIDVHFRCGECSADFLWSAQEQKVWFEDYRFWVDSYPKFCRTCRAERRKSLLLRQEYDDKVAGARLGGSLEQKHRLIEIIDFLENRFAKLSEKIRIRSDVLPRKILETRELFRRQLAKSGLQSE